VIAGHGGKPDGVTDYNRDILRIKLRTLIGAIRLLVGASRDDHDSSQNYTGGDRGKSAGTDSAQN
jgi:hypothetical protein